MSHKISLEQVVAVLLVILVLLLAGVVVSLLLLNNPPAFRLGPVLRSEPDAAAVENSARPNWTMAERIRFQDRLDQVLAVQTTAVERGPRPNWTMAERIRFQDRMWEQGSWR